MKRILAVAAVVALLAGCDSKPDAPFGLRWGQSMDSVSFIKDGDCEKKRAETICSFDNTPPFNDWSYENTLKFKSDKLVEINTMFNGVDSRSTFCAMLAMESEYLSSVINIKDNSQLTSAVENCSELSRNALGREALSEDFESKYGKVSVFLMIDPYVGSVTYSPPTK